MNKPINITEARELFAKTTQGEWHQCANPYVLASEINGTVLSACASGSNNDAAESDVLFCIYVHNNYLAMLDELERLRAKVAQQQAELGEYWRAAVACESLDEAVSDKGLADLHSIRTGNSYSQVGPSVAEMLQNQRDELQTELERLREFEAAVILATHWEPMQCKQMVWDARQTLAVRRGETQG